ncbi:hypothetical protein NC651_014536 [Populus alba x Populus x berolinensis]|nr:hypothetical protein NC651_014530 [Populus alba x Populus x berolinensis]KAJ6920985.1 hypothetical protein NC651_014534 [Populus alba x Populus x berolinensis]KAJ6920988.1 hypothetical protein NC651_014536 [Populus alba x Populus x berolinensis]
MGLGNHQSGAALIFILFFKKLAASPRVMYNFWKTYRRAVGDNISGCGLYSCKDQGVTNIWKAPICK